MKRSIVTTLLLLLTLVGLAPGPAAADEEVGTADWVSVSLGHFHACGIRTSGRMYCWGDDTYGELGDGGPNTGQSVPVEVFGGATNWASVSAGLFHTCARKVSGRLFCWGRDDHNQIGDGGPPVDQAIPTEVAGGPTNWTSVAVGDNSSCGIRASGRMFCWGADTFGQLGDGGGSFDQAVPVVVAGGHTDWTAVAGGATHTCGLRAAGRAYCWGSDFYGETGDGGPPTHPPTHRYVPVEVAGHHTDWTAVSAGEGTTCGRRRPGQVFCWGSDFFGELGNGGANTDSATPALVLGGSSWRSVSLGRQHACARKVTGRLFCWGSDFRGQLGNGAPNNNRAAPVEVDGSRTDWADVGAGGDFTCALRVNGRLFCWGRDVDGQLGDGGVPTDQPAPVQVH